MMVMVRASAGVILIRMSPLTMTSKLRMRMTAMGYAPINNVAGGMGLDCLLAWDWGCPGRTAEPSLVFTLLVAHIILSIVRNGKVTIMSGEGPWRSQGGTVGAQ